AFDPSFTGGVRGAAAQVNLDAIRDVIAAPRPGGGPHVKVFNGANGAQLAGPIGSFFAFDPSFTGGLWVAGGDINGDGNKDVIVGADSGGGPNVRVFSGATGAVLLDFFAYSPSFTGGVRVAAADFDPGGDYEISTARAALAVCGVRGLTSPGTATTKSLPPPGRAEVPTSEYSTVRAIHSRA